MNLPMPAAPVRVLVLDDSAAMRRLVSQGLTRNGLLVVGEAASADEARAQIKVLSPDVLTLDIEMPGMNGLQFLENLMRLRPMPVIMVSTLTAERAPAALAAFELGALDVVLKPTSAAEVATFHDELAEKVRWAAHARRPLLPRRVDDEHVPALRTPAWIDGTVIVLGASTGGTEALQQVFRQLPGDLPPIVVVQHIPAGFSTAFAATLNRVSAVTVSEAEDGDVLETGRAYVAPGGRQLRIQTRGPRRRLRVTDEGRHNHHAPSVDLLFGSLAPTAAAFPIVAGLMTGMGADGAVGLKALHDGGARTFAQDQVSSVVWGMPQAAIRLGAADEVVGVRDMASCIVRLIGAQHTRATSAMAR